MSSTPLMRPAPRRRALPNLWRKLCLMLTALKRGACRRDHATLDRAALRDLALDRSELDSYLAESLGMAERTRRRVAGPALARAGVVIAMAATAAACVAHDEPVTLGAAPSPAASPPKQAIDNSDFPRQFPDPQGEIEPLPDQF